MNDTLTTLFEAFLDETPCGPLADELHAVSAELDLLVESKAVTHEILAAYEAAAFAYAFQAGFLAGRDAA